MEGNQISEIPEWISKLDRVFSLILSKNQLTSFENVLNMTKLETLSLGENKISYVSPEIKNLKGLKRLDLSFNRISEVPKELFEIPITILSLSYNPIQSLPEDIDLNNNMRIHLYNTQIPQGDIGDLKEKFPEVNITTGW